MRYLLAFILGSILGAGALFLYLRNSERLLSAERGPLPQTNSPAIAETSNSTRPSHAPPAMTTAAPPPAPKSEEQLLAESVGIELSPINSATEKSIAAEPQLKVVPPLQSPQLDATSIVIPVVGVERSQLRNMFHERRGTRQHRAIDIAAARGTPIVASIDGPVGKLFLSKAGGITVYQYDPKKEWIYYYAHLDAYTPGLAEGQMLRRGDVIGFVGTTGNAPPNAPHLHFSIEKLTQPGVWWKSEPIDPYPLLSSRGVTIKEK